MYIFFLISAIYVSASVRLVRFEAIKTAAEEKSVKIALRFSYTAAAPVIFKPQKVSNTVSPSTV